MDNATAPPSDTPATRSPFRRVLRMLYTAIVLLVLFIAFIVAALYFGQTYIIFPATRGLQSNPTQLGYAYEEVKLDVMGEKTVGWFIKADNPRGTVLFSHGNGGNIAGWMYGMDVYVRELHLNVLLYDYGGYGDSTGSPSEQRCYADIRAMWDWLTTTKGIPTKQIVLVGRSLGGGVTSKLASEVTPGAICLESTFLSVPRVAKEIFPVLPANLILRHRFDTESRLQRFTAPVLVVHGKYDEVIPFHHGEAIYGLLKGPKQFLEIRGGHNDGYDISVEEYRETMEGFVLPFLK